MYESPNHCHKCVTNRIEFNLTATYTKESDFKNLYWTNSGLYWKDSNLTSYEKNKYDKRDIYSTKNDFSVSLISNCGDYAKFRIDYMLELKKYINLDIYGGCGIKCPVKECREHLSKKYKFFFVFENSYCRDYITEKFFDTFKYDVIPVVFGGGDYSYYIPKSGFINADDFKSPLHLANFLIALDGNPAVYNSYFTWKKYIGNDLNRPSMGIYCEMCIKLHLEEVTGKVEYKTVKHLEKYYDLDLNCLKPTKDENFNVYKKKSALTYSMQMNPD